MSGGDDELVGGWAMPTKPKPRARFATVNALGAATGLPPVTLLARGYQQFRWSRRAVVLCLGSLLIAAIASAFGFVALPGGIMAFLFFKWTKPTRSISINGGSVSLWAEGTFSSRIKERIATYPLSELHCDRGRLVYVGSNPPILVSPRQWRDLSAVVNRLAEDDV